MSSETKYLNSEYKDFFEKSLLDSDPEIYKAVNDELVRQQNHIELIASENIVSQAVLEAQGSILTNKYAEGYPGKRYYNGCEHVDVAEQLAIDRLKELFNCKFANAQPHSGAQANGAVFLALLKPGDTFMGMSLNSGGHITHGLMTNFLNENLLNEFYFFKSDKIISNRDKINISSLVKMINKNYKNKKKINTYLDKDILTHYY